nr:MAG TPA: hypothetical protein [Bacteriophage sp.]
MSNHPNSHLVHQLGRRKPPYATILSNETSKKFFKQGFDQTKK